MADKVLKRTMVVIEEGTLTSMALNATIAKEFPILAPIAKLARKTGGGGCGTCGAAARERAATFQRVKQAIASMDSDRKRRLKDSMNAQNMRIMYKDNSGKAQQLTF